MRKLSRVLCLFCVCAVAVAGWAVPTVVNGSFEADTFAFSGTLGLGCGNTLTGWQTQCSSDQIYPWGLGNVNSYGAGPTPYGNQWLVVGDFGNGGSAIFQTIGGFTPGQSYTLNFALASEEPANVGAMVQVSFPVGSSTGSVILTAPIGTLWNNWAMYAVNFVATGSSVEIRFDGLAGAGFDAGIDNVYISGGSNVPEPSTLALLGSSLIGLAVRRFKK